MTVDTHAVKNTFKVFAHTWAIKKSIKDGNTQSTNKSSASNAETEPLERHATHRNHKDTDT